MHDTWPAVVSTACMVYVLYVHMCCTCMKNVYYISTVVRTVCIVYVLYVLHE